MLDTLGALGRLLGGTLGLRPYVFAFLAVFLAAGVRDLGGARTAGLLLWAWGLALAAELCSTRIGIPFGLYHYTGATRGVELYVSDVPFFDSLSFPFLAYAALCLARATLGERAGRARLTALAGALMMLLDVVIDPLAVRGDRWFLGRIFYYPAGGAYWGVPISNFAGWLAVGWATVGGYLAGTRGTPARGTAGPGLGVALYYGVLAFNVGMTLWIGEAVLAATGMLIHVALFLLLYCVGASRVVSPQRGEVGERTRS